MFHVDGLVVLLLLLSYYQHVILLYSFMNDLYRVTISIV